MAFAILPCHGQCWRYVIYLGVRAAILQIKSLLGKRSTTTLVPRKSRLMGLTFYFAFFLNESCCVSFSDL